MRKSGQLLGSPSKIMTMLFYQAAHLSLSLSLSLVLRLVVHVDGGVKRKGVGETKEGIMAWDPKGRPCMLALFLSSDL
jgi:hypothetical protein